MVFDYSTQVHRRKHGPAGYQDYESYRPWLRDEFSFRCVYCLRRERWGLRRGNWDIEHFVPQSADENKRLDYENLLYACRTCNLNKSASLALDPCQVGFGNLVQVNEDGVIRPLNDDGAILIQALRLDNDDYTEFRHLMLRILSALQEHDPQLYARLMSYPDDLPNLQALKPPQNTRPEGVAQSCLAHRNQGELPATY